MKKRIITATMIIVCMLATQLGASVTSVFYSASSPPPTVPSGAIAIGIPWEDTYLNENYPDESEGANAILTYGDTSTVLIDVSDAIDILSGTIHDAQLSLYAIGAESASIPMTWSAHLVSSPWNRNIVTWNTAPTTAGTPETTGSIPCNAEEYNQYDVTSLLNEYVSNDSSYYGISLSGAGNTALLLGDANNVAGKNTLQQPYLMVISDSITDDQAPDIIIQNPVDGVTSPDADVTISGVAFDDIAIDRVEVEGNVATGTENWEYTLTGLADGIYTVMAIVYDVGGNAATDTVSFTVDTSGGVTDDVPPAIAILNPENNTTSKVSNVVISGIANDNINVASVTVNGLPANGLNNWNIELTLADGTHTITATAEDNSGNTAIDVITVVVDSSGEVDNTPPLITITSPADGTVSPVDAVTLAGIASDDIDLASVKVRNETTGSAWMSAIGMVSWQAPLSLVQGTNVLSAMATDNSGNTAQDSIIVIYDSSVGPDDTAPVITILNPADSTITEQATVTISGSAFDDVALASVTVNGIPALGLENWQVDLTLAQGVNTITAMAVDSSGNVAYDTITVEYDPNITPDTTPPVVLIENPLDGTVSSVADITISGMASDDVDLSSVRLNGAVTDGLTDWSKDVTLSEGTNTFTAVAEDNSGNTAQDTIIVIYDPNGGEDDTPPLITITSPADGTVSPVDTIMLAGIASDDIDLANVQVRNETTGSTWMNTVGMATWQAPLTLVEGANVLTAMATDNSGNTAQDSITVIYDPNSGPDDTAPVITIVNPADATVSQVANVTISGSAFDDVALASVTVNGVLASGLENWQVDLTLAQGVNTITAMALDSSGNVAYDTITVEYDPNATPDTTPPVVLIENPLDGTVSSVADITISGMASDDVDLSRVWLNGAVTDGLTDWSKDVTLTEGTNTFTAVAEDNSGNTAQDTIIVIYDPNGGEDDTPPWVEIQSPADGSTSLSPWVTVTGQATDDVNVVSVMINGIPAIGINDWTVDVPLVAGANVITVTATDNSGNTATDTITVIYDSSQGPDIVITSPQDGAEFPGNAATIVVRGTVDTGKQLISALTLNGEAIDQSDLPNWEHTVTLTEGDNVLLAYVETDMGRTAQDHITVTLDSTLPSDDTPPELAITSPSDGALIPEAMTNVYSALGTAIDETGIATLTVRVEPTMPADWDVDLYTLPDWDAGLIDLAAGDNLIIATATDFGGNVTVVTNTVTVTTVDPTPGMVIDITPDETWNKGEQATVITGKNFQAGADIFLVGNSASIPASIADVVIGGVKAYATFTVEGAPVGVYDVMVVNPDGSWGIGDDLFTINSINDITNETVYTPFIERVEPFTLVNNYNNDIVVYGSNFFNVQSISFTNAAGYWFRGIDIDVEQSTLTSIYCRAMCGTDLAPQGIPRETGLFDIYVTAINDLTGSKADAVDLVVDTPPTPIEDVVITLSNDYKHVIVTWNGPDNVMVYTNVNRYYSPFSDVDGNWDIAEGSATWPWVFDASGTESLYIHLTDSTGPDPSLDGPIDVGKFDVTLVGGTRTLPGINWVAPPFNLFDTSLKATFKDQLTPEGAPPLRDVVFYQSSFGGVGVKAYYAPGGIFTPITEFPQTGGGMLVERRHAGDVTLTFTGWVPTNSYVIGPLPKSDGIENAKIWLNTLYPAPVSLDTSGLAASGVVIPAGAPPLRDTVYQIKGNTGIKANYANGTWMSGNADAKILWPGGMFILDINKTHTGSSTNWYYPKPY